MRQKIAHPMSETTNATGTPTIMPNMELPLVKSRLGRI